VELPEAHSFADYVCSYAQRAASPEFKEAGDYWRNKFAAGYEALVLPADHHRPARRSLATRRIDYPIPSALVQDMRALGVKQGCSFFATMLGAISILMARISRQRSFVIALPTADQPVIGQPDLVGHCVSLLPFAVNLTEGETTSAFLTRVQRELAETQDHSAFTLVHLLEELRPVVSAPGVSPIPAGITNVKKYAAQELSQIGFSVDYDANPMSFQSFEFYLNAVEKGDSLELKCHYDTELFEPGTVQEWLEAFIGILREAVADPSRAATELANLEEQGRIPAPRAVYVLPTSNMGANGIPIRNAVLVPVTERVSSQSFPHSPAPEAELLTAMLDLWRRTLNVPGVGPDQDFFALGGQSMLAAQLFMVIERELGLAGPLATLYESPTPRTLVKALMQRTGQEAWRSLVAINRSGSRIPLFLIHAAEGNVLLYRDLARYLGPDQPVYGLQAAGLDGKSPIDAEFEHVASRYIREIRQVQASGPYLLGGYCLGGTIALEVARQFQEAEESIGLVAMIEDFNIKSTRWPLPWHFRMVNRLLNPYYHLQNLLAAQGSSKWDFLGEKARVELTRAKVSTRVAMARARRTVGIPSEYHHVKIADAFDHALQQYEVKPYPGELTVFKAKRHLAGMGDPLDGWGEVAKGGVRLFTFSTSPRGSLIEPFVQTLAARLRECLDVVSSVGVSDDTAA
jgi:thioesterase domain-containing protein